MNSEIYEVFVQSPTHRVFQNQTLIILKKESGPFTLISHLFSRTQTQQKPSQSHTLLFVSFSFTTRTQGHLQLPKQGKEKRTQNNTITRNCLVWPLFTYFLIIFCSVFYILFVNAKAENWYFLLVLICPVLLIGAKSEVVRTRELMFLFPTSLLSPFFQWTQEVLDPSHHSSSWGFSAISLERLTADCHSTSPSSTTSGSINTGSSFVLSSIEMVTNFWVTSYLIFLLFQHYNIHSQFSVPNHLSLIFQHDFYFSLLDPDWLYVSSWSNFDHDDTVPALLQNNSLGEWVGKTTERTNEAW